MPARTADPNLARLARLLDSAFRVPGTDFRLGLDAVIGLVPGVGDLAGAAMSGYIVLAAVRAGAPPTVLVMMLMNVAVDTLAGAVPVVGDLFDAGWRSNTRNVALLQRHLDEPAAARGASRLVVVGVFVALLVLVAAGLAATVVGVRALLRLAS